MTDKKALLIGINYIGSECELFGCINDVINMKQWLIDEQEYSPDNITVLTEASENPLKLPTKTNILNEIKNLVTGCKQGSRRFIHYSGHGSWQWDNNNDESDHRDETICPLDYAKSGDITDDLLRKVLIDPMPEGSLITGLFDCCHSGTVLDLKYHCITRADPTFCSYELVSSKEYQNTNAKAIIFSGCRDNQTSADGFENNQPQGAMTYSFLQAYKDLKQKDKTMTYKKLMKNLSIIIRKRGYKQIPQMSSGFYINLKDTFEI